MRKQDSAGADFAVLPDAATPADPARRQRLIAGGSLLGALAASSCCILPLALFSAGVTGAWIGNLTALSPYQPYFIAATAGFLGVGFYRVYRKSGAVSCQAAGACGARSSQRFTKVTLWLSTGLVLAALAFPYYAPLLLGT
jgi:mercuric ion transport protein